MFDRFLDTPLVRKEKLTQGPAPDPKCMLNISFFFTLAHILD